MTLSKEQFLSQTEFASCQIENMAGDASIKTFYRLTKNNARAILMKMPFDDSAYTKEAGLAKTCLPFLAIGQWLEEQHLSVPKVLAKNIHAGFVLLEDLGQKAYTQDHLPLAVAVLNHLHKTKPSQTLPYENQTYHLPAFTKEIYRREPLLFIEWFLPARSIQLEEEAKKDFCAFWDNSWQTIEKTKQSILLRDYHSPNFLLLPERTGIQQLGLLDFQDALLGSSLYDLVSLTQDARIDISPQQEARALETYAHSFNDEAFALLGAQRALKVLGIFTRFAQQDKKPRYLKHIARVQTNLERNLNHPALVWLKKWLKNNGEI